MRRIKTNFSDAFAKVLQKHRTEMGLSRESLAQKAQLHQTYIGLIERGMRNPSLDTASAIAQAMDIPLSKLIAEAEKLWK